MWRTLSGQVIGFLSVVKPSLHSSVFLLIHQGYPSEGTLQLLAMACLSLAMKYEEVRALLAFVTGICGETRTGWEDAQVYTRSMMDIVYAI